eukprot:1188528-Prorocentrum_minimum.AAC.4
MERRWRVDGTAPLSSSESSDGLPITCDMYSTNTVTVTIAEGWYGIDTGTLGRCSEWLGSGHIKGRNRVLQQERTLLNDARNRMGGATVVPLNTDDTNSDGRNAESSSGAGENEDNRDNVDPSRVSFSDNPSRPNRRSSNISEDFSWNGGDTGTLNVDAKTKGEDIGLITLVERLTEQQVAEFKECFDMFDEDGSGNIDSDELKDILSALGVKMAAMEIAELVGEVDSDGSGDVDFPEFCALMARQMYATGEEHQLRQVFDVLDEHG